MDNVILSDLVGQQRINTRRPAGEPLPPLGDPELADHAIATRRTLVSDLFIGRVLNVR